MAGVVYLKFANSRRRPAVELTANSEVDANATGSNRALATPLGARETGFALDVELEKNKLEAIMILQDGDVGANDASSSINVI